MNTLVAFTLLVAAAVAEPQYFYSGVAPSTYYGGVYPSAVVAKSSVYPYATPYVAASQYIATPYAAAPVTTYPVQDTSRGLPQPVQDTPEVKFAKSAFAAEYASTVSRNTGAVAVPVHNIHKRAAVFPLVKTPASTVYSAPVVSAYSYGAYPYAATYGAYPAYNTYNAYNTFPYAY